jgi:hypothetical protein
VIARGSARARASSRAIDLSDLARVGGDHFLRARHSRRSASTDGWYGRCREATTTATAAGYTALEVSGAGTQSCQGVARALRGPAAVPSTAARGFGAAFDVGRGAGAGARDVRSAAGAAAGGANADTWGAPRAGARAVHDGSLGHHAGLDGGGAEEEDGGDEDGEMHLR